MNRLKQKLWSEYLELDRCECDLQHFIKTYCKLDNSCECDEPELIVLNQYQKNLVDMFNGLNNPIFTYPQRQEGNTTILVLIAIHKLLFGVDSKVLFVSVNREMSLHAHHLFAEIYDRLPEKFKMCRLSRRNGIVTSGGNSVHFVSDASEIYGLSVNLALMDCANSFNLNVLTSLTVVNRNRVNIVTY